MVYSNHFVMSVLLDGVPQKELHNGTIRLPFEAEYELRFRNKNHRRAVVQIFIDGENVSGGGYVVGANSYVDIKRHHDIDRRFKFVSLDSAEAVDFGKNGPNEDKVKGTIEARFFLEKERPKPVEHHHHHHHHDYHHHDYWPRTEPWKPYDPYRPLWCGNTSGPTGNVMRTKSLSRGISGSSCGNDVQYGAASVGPQNLCSSGDVECSVGPIGSSGMESLRDGCTVEGAMSGQYFSTVHIDLEDNYVAVKCFLQGYDPSVRVQSEPGRVVHEPARDRRTRDLEDENDELRRKVAELENEKLRKQLEDAKKT